MKKYKYVGEYEDAHRKVKLIPGEIVELADFPARLAKDLQPVEEEPVAPKPVAKAPKTTKPKKKKQS